MPLSYGIVQGHRAGDAVCPLSRAPVGTRVCVKQLTSRPEVCDRLRELGLVEDQEIRLVSRHHDVICQICNARFALSEALADTILVKPLSASAAAQ